MTTDRACFIPEAVSPCSYRCHEMMATDVACFIPEGVSQCSGRYHKTITTDRACLIQTERISPCSDCCHEMMPTVQACLGDEIPCSVHCCGMMTTDRAFVMRRVQLIEHALFLRGYHHVLTVVIR